MLTIITLKVLLTQAKSPIPPDPGIGHVLFPNIPSLRNMVPPSDSQFTIPNPDQKDQILYCLNVVHFL